jgi:hypothetical protein
VVVGVVLLRVVLLGVVVAATVLVAAVVTTAEVTDGTSVAVAASDPLAPEVLESEFDIDIAPRPAKTIASAINTIASARNGGPPVVGFG